MRAVIIRNAFDFEDKSNDRALDLVAVGTADGPGTQYPVVKAPATPREDECTINQQPNRGDNQAIDTR